VPRFLTLQSYRDLGVPIKSVCRIILQLFMVRHVETIHCTPPTHRVSFNLELKVNRARFPNFAVIWDLGVPNKSVCMIFLQVLLVRLVKILHRAPCARRVSFKLGLEVNTARFPNFAIIQLYRALGVPIKSVCRIIMQIFLVRLVERLHCTPSAHCVSFKLGLKVNRARFPNFAVIQEFGCADQVSL
jgi:hypothetical protein